MCIRDRSLKPLAEEACASATAGWVGAVEFSLDAALTAWADREKLRGALVNGIRNALDAMGQTGVLTLRGEASRASVGLTVEDTGGGVAPDDLQKLFTPFFTTKTNGTGLGLAYSRKVLEGMGGSATLGNGARGAVFQLRLAKAKEGSGG